MTSVGRFGVLGFKGKLLDVHPSWREVKGVRGWGLGGRTPLYFPLWGTTVPGTSPIRLSTCRAPGMDSDQSEVNGGADAPPPPNFLAPQETPKSRLGEPDLDAWRISGSGRRPRERGN